MRTYALMKMELSVNSTEIFSHMQFILPLSIRIFAVMF